MAKHMFIYSIFGIVIILVILTDAFETVILPRRINRRIRLSRIFFKTFWKLCKKGRNLFQSANDTKDYLGFFGPLSLIILLSIWAIAIIVGFALINFGLQTDIRSPFGTRDFITYLYLSGATLFTMGWNDTYPLQILGRFLVVAEGGLGFAFLAVVIGYLPVIYQGFSHREVNINLLDSRAGSPPNAVYLLEQLAKGKISADIKPQLEEWEVWCAELLETHLSYPVLAFYRSQHDSQSWVAALLMILDASALVLICENKSLHANAKSTFAIGRHAAVDLTLAFHLTPQSPPLDRMTKKDLVTLRKLLKDSNFSLKEGVQVE
jgi:hypothetical protein